MRRNITIKPDKICIENILPLKWGEHHDNSFIRSTQLALNALGEDYTYEYLMGLSGAAFRMHFHPTFCPSAADSTTGFDVSQVLFKAVGYEVELFTINDKRFKDIKVLYKKVVAQINLGIPIIAINLKVCPEWGLITGYLKSKPGLLCRTYFDDSDEYALADHAPWLSYFIGEKGKPPNDSTRFIDSLKIAVKLFRTPFFEAYYSGKVAFEKWIVYLQSHLDAADTRSFDKIEENLTLLNTLLDARRAAYNYFQNHSDNVNLTGRKEILDKYAKEVDLLTALQDVLPKFGSAPDQWTSDSIRGQIIGLI